MTNPSQSATDSRPADEDEQYQQPPDDAYPIPDRQIPVSEALIRSVIDSLERVEDFIRRYANPSVHQDLRHYAQTQGWHPATGPQAFLDSIALGAHSLAHVLTAERRPPQA